MTHHDPNDTPIEPDERADGSSYREDGSDESEMADGSSYRTDAHPLEDERADPDRAADAAS